MSTNEQRAAEVLRDDKHYRMGPHGERFLTSEAARTLADAGLLKPDLPEPDKQHHDFDVWAVHPPRRIFVTQTKSGHPAPVNLQVEDVDIDLGPQGAREIALALLAAVEYAEKENNNE